MSKTDTPSNAAIFQTAKRIFGDVLTLKNAPLFLAPAFIFAWLPDGLWALVQQCFESQDKRNFMPGLLQSGFSILILFLMVWWFHKKFRSLETTVKPNKAHNHPQENLILFLSVLQESPLSEANNTATSKELSDRHSWQMANKAIEHHESQLLHLYVIPSKESAAQFDLFERLVKGSYPKITVHRLSAIDFENIDEVYEEVDHAYHLIKENGYKEKDIVLDITGGQKVTSIIGAIFSLGFDRRFQYVSTKDKRVLAYDLDYVFKE